MLLSDVKNVYCLFEQSGHFKNVFISLGFNAYDYDLLNDYGETDYIIDLFDEIENAYLGNSSIFDNFDKDDLIFAFFPCIRFSSFGSMMSLCHTSQTINLPDKDKVYSSMVTNNSIHRFYNIFCKLYFVCLDRGLRVIIENPTEEQHYLNRYFPIKPKVIVYDRHSHGDYYKKPTQFFFINFVPCISFSHYYPKLCKRQIVEFVTYGAERSLICEEFIKWFVQEYIFEDVNFNFK